MSDTVNSELDVMLTATEDEAATMEDPNTDGTVNDQPQGEQTQAATEDNDAGSAGRQSDNTDDGDAQEDEQAKSDTVPVATLIEQRRAFQKQLKATNAQMLDLRDEINELRNSSRQPAADDADEDDDEPLTRAEFRKLQREQAEQTTARTKQQEEQRIASALMMADPTEQRLLQISQRYLSKADERAIVGADDVLATAISTARERLEMLGTDEELALMNRLYPPEQPKPKEKKADASRDTTKGKPKQAATGDSGTELSQADDVDPHTRNLLDYIFTG